MRRWDLSGVLVAGLTVMTVAAVVMSVACVAIWTMLLLGRGAQPTVVSEVGSDQVVALPATVNPSPLPSPMVSPSPLPSLPPSLTGTARPAAPTTAPAGTEVLVTRTVTRPAPTETPSPTETAAAATSTPSPTNTESASPTWTPTHTATPTETPIPSATPIEAAVIIYHIDKVAEWIEIQNVGGTAQNLAGWMVISERGDEECPLPWYDLMPGQILRIWTFTADAGLNDASCGAESPIWLDDELDPAVLFNDLGYEVDREPPR